MSDEQIILTRAGYEELQKELQLLVDVELPEMTARMAEVRDDVQVNEETAFFDTLSDKGRLDERIARLRMILARAVIIDEDPDPESASPGDRVTVQDLDSKEKMHFDLLGSQEVAHGRRGVSIASPVGKALLGQKKGATVEVKVPDGIARYKILSLGKIPANE